jgi:hypothetical protein
VSGSYCKHQEEEIFKINWEAKPETKTLLRDMGVNGNEILKYE